MTDKYCVIGNPIAHSKSPLIHTQFAMQTNQDISYDALLVEAGQFNEVIEKLLLSHKGANVTVPFKEDAFNRCEILSTRAQRAGAVNTLSFAADKVHGDNTDGIGMINDILNHGFEIKNKRVLIVGAGGAVRGVLESLLNQYPQSITLVNRTMGKAVALAEIFQDIGEITVTDFESLTGAQFDLVINGTSGSLSNEIPPLPERIFSSQSLAYDMMYSDKPTVFMDWANIQGATQTLDGKGMLIGQAAESFYIWRGVRPKTNISL